MSSWPSLAQARMMAVFARHNFRLVGASTYPIRRFGAPRLAHSRDEVERLRMRARQGEMREGDLSGNAEDYRRLVTRWLNSRNQLKPAQNILRHV